MSKDLKQTLTRGSMTVSTEQKNEKPPEGAEIFDKSERTETEEIENGYLVTKHCSGRYRKKGQTKDDYGSYFSYTQKWYSKEDPLTITVNDKALAEAFESEEN